VDYSIRFVVEWPDFEILSFPNRIPGKEDADPSLVCKLQVAGMIDEGKMSPYQSLEGTSLKRVLEDLQQLYSNFLAEIYPEFTFEMAPILTSAGCLNIPVDIYGKSGKATASAKTADIVSQYLNIESSNKLLCFRIGYGWIHQKEEDATMSSFRAGIRYYLVAPRGSLSTSLKSAKSGGGQDDSSGSAFIKPTILVPRRRAASRGDQQVQAALSLPPTVPRKQRKKARCATPMNLDMTKNGPDSKFQERLLEEGCGSQVISSPHRYIFPSYTSNHSYNPHLFCKYVGSPGSVIFPLQFLFFLFPPGPG
jgi:hypothetical protein